MSSKTVTRGVLIREEHVETLKRLPAKTMDAVIGAAFRVAIGEKEALQVRDGTGIIEALVQSIAAAAVKFEEKEAERKAKDALRKKNSRERDELLSKMKMIEAGQPDEESERETISIGQRGKDADKNGQTRTKTDKGGQNPQDGRGQKRTDADKNRTDAEKNGQEGTKTESARKKEGRKEGIYIPQTPKGDRLLPPEIDVGEMMGESTGSEDGGPRDEEAGTGEAEDREGKTVAEAAAEMAARHPNQTGLDGFAKTLARYLKKNGGGELGGMLAQIAAAHRKWVASGAWDEDEGRYAPQLKNWLWGGDWKRTPPEKKRARQAEDADDFHAGASL